VARYIKEQDGSGAEILEGRGGQPVETAWVLLGRRGLQSSWVFAEDFVYDTPSESEQLKHLGISYQMQNIPQR
jgi:hypothetical protein